VTEEQLKNAPDFVTKDVIASREAAQQAAQQQQMLQQQQTPAPTTAQ
jgi:hypothetical protein